LRRLRPRPAPPRSSPSPRLQKRDVWSCRRQRRDPHADAPPSAPR
jgi:hypothetical protein